MSDKNLLCIILTVLLAFFTVGTAFHAGNWLLATETLFIWAILYLMLPCAQIMHFSILCPNFKPNLKPLFFKTIENRYIFVSFCAALLVSMIFDDTLNHTGRFFEDSQLMDLFAVFAAFLISALVSLSFYYLLSKNKIDKLKNYGFQIDALVQEVKFLHGKCYVIAYAINPLNKQKIRLIGSTFAKKRQEIPQWLSVYFNRKNPDDYFFDTYSWIK